MHIYFPPDAFPARWHHYIRHFEINTQKLMKDSQTFNTDSAFIAVRIC